jgi:hypothetical protein
MGTQETFAKLQDYTHCAVAIDAHVRAVVREIWGAGAWGEIPAMFCEHANENPISCPCPPNCYCKPRTCKSKGQPTAMFSPSTAPSPSTAAPGPSAAPERLTYYRHKDGYWTSYCKDPVEFLTYLRLDIAQADVERIEESQRDSNRKWQSRYDEVCASLGETRTRVRALEMLLVHARENALLEALVLCELEESERQSGHDGVIAGQGAAAVGARIRDLIKKGGA